MMNRHNIHAAFDIKTVDWNLDIQRDRLRQRAIKERIKNTDDTIGWSWRWWWWLYYDQVQPWLLCSLIGVSIGLLVGFLHVCSVWLSDLKDGLCVDSWYLSRKFCCWETSLDECEGWLQWSQVFSLWKDYEIINFGMYTLLSLLMATCAFYLVCNYSLYAMSSGLPEIRSILSGFTPLILTASNEDNYNDKGEMMNMFVSLKTGMIKAIGACLAVGSGLSLGMELPLVHVAACLCTFFFSLFASSTGKSGSSGSSSSSSRFSLDQGGSALLRREIMTAASASALAVALGAPIAGVLFSLEELSLTSSPSTRSPSQLFSMAFYCCIVASAVLTHVMDPFRTGKLVMFHSTYLREYHVWELFIFALIGAVFGGVFGFLFVRCSIFLAHTRRNGYFNSGTGDNASWLDWLRWIPKVMKGMMRRIDQWVNHDNERNNGGDGFNDTASDTPLSPSRSADAGEGLNASNNSINNGNPQENIQRWWFPTDVMMKRSFQELFIVTLVTALVSYSHPYLRDDMSYFLSGLLTECPQDKKVISPNAPTVISTWNNSSSSTGVLMQMHQGIIDWDSMLDKRDDIPTDSGDSSGSGRGHGSIGDDSDYFRLCSSMPANLIAMLILTGTLRTVLTLVTFGLKIPSGVYLPSMLIGACFGRAVGMIVQALTPTSIVITPGTYALVGAASGLAGVSRLTVSVVVVMFEITGGGALNYIVPIMVALMSSRFVADGLDAYYFRKYSNAPVESRDKGMKFLQKYTGSVTDAYMKFHGYPYLDLKKTWRFLRERDMIKYGRGDSAILEKRVIYESVTALDVITKPMNQLYVIPAYKSSSTWKPYCHTAGSLKQFISTFSQVSGYPVVETLENGIVIGYISREDMLKFLAEYSTQSDLQKRCYFMPPEELAAYFEHENHISDVSRQVSPNRELSSTNLTDSVANSEDPINPDSSNVPEDSPINILIDNAASLNFYPLMNITPVKIQPHYPTDLIVELFKKLGLRSLFVVKEGMAVYANTIPSSFDLVLLSSSEQNEESASFEGTATSACSFKDRPLGSIMGIITRKDLLRAIERLEIGDHFVKSEMANGDESLSNMTSPTTWNDFLTVPSQKRTSSPAVSFLSGINQNARAAGSKSETDVGSSSSNRRYREVGNIVASTAPPDADSGDDMFLDAFGKPIQK